jgi:hypothetical protein
MDRYIRSYPATGAYKHRVYRPEFYRLNIAIGVVVLIALLSLMNKAW